MARREKTKSKSTHRAAARLLAVIAGVCAVFGVIYLVGFVDLFPTQYSKADSATSTDAVKTDPPPAPTLDKNAYNAKMLSLAHVSLASSTLPAQADASTTATSTASTTVPIPPQPVSTATTSVSVPGQLWPQATVYPNAGALLPFNRIVAYYGNFYSTGMGVLGEYPEDEVLSKLMGEVANWEAADPSTPVIPAIDYIAVTAQGSPGADGKYRLRMPDDQIEKAIDMANQVNGIVILDVQVGLSSVETEVPLLEKYLSLPNVHLALDPEFAMQTSGEPPGTVIGTLDAKDINWAAQYLAGLVQKDNLPPKILVIHRFTEDMVTNYQNITPLPEVEIVMDMDGWGFPAKKINTYDAVVNPEPVQFTGFKLFYKNDVKPPSTRLLTPAEILDLTPAPVFIQYQ